MATSSVLQDVLVFIRCELTPAGSRILLSAKRECSRMRLRLLTGFILFCLALFVANSTPASAQVSAAISGLVTDESGAAVSGATVNALALETRAQRSVA